MALKTVFCPNCGNETQINTEKAFCFCLQCGNKIIFKTKSTPFDAEQNNDKQTADHILQKIEEAGFYYKLSHEKKEDENYSGQPIYYLKAQDILVDLSEMYPNDYRIWWELCKPIDFGDPLSASDIFGQYEINSTYFNKALDKAPLAEKQRLIQERDLYLEKKLL